MDSDSKALLLSLSRYLRPAISLPPRGVGEPISETLATFADNRHRVGPLLHMAMQNCADITATGPAATLLESACQKNLIASLKQKAAEQRISKLLKDHSIPFTVLKGRGLAQQLHDNSAVRRSKDIDILISPDRSRQAIAMMNQQGYIYKSATLKRTEIPQSIRQKMELKRFKDITFIDPAVSVPIELHQRLFKFEPRDLTGDFNNSVQFDAQPSLSNSFYCLYLVLHGSLAMWPRLKWVVDLSIVARNMPADNRLEMLSIAATYGCDTAVAASLLMTEQVFPDSLDDGWQQILKPYMKARNTAELKDLFFETLTADTNGRPNLPWKSSLLSGSADIIFSGKIGLMDSTRARVLNSVFARI
ncbi:nucleotidyltransferase family protein [uncultured Parasphingorhabdus sp.]|uniref:nucleotidyltransferase family protein n=1 Tax=uncultured Parasphingorhabdus sp. TaxID=2709694 RepID=UPI002AA6A6FA|nr:nucleotidyltransferase family protein [uncultured Parasphingorhabdus sp.]